MRFKHLTTVFASLLALQAAMITARPNPQARTVASWLRLYHKGPSGIPDGSGYRVAYADLNGDGINEALVYLEGREACGSGGCTLYVLTSRGGSWHRLSEHTIVRLPVQALNTRHHGWRDLSVFVAGGGILPGYTAVLPFDGKTYPSNPTVPPAHPIATDSSGRVLISDATPLHSLD